MEVHQHTHTPRKKWTHYFWEFLMLFLAFTLGFFVENQREHFIENKREKEYIHSLITDLARDTVNANLHLRGNILKFNGLDTLIDILNSDKPIDSAVTARLYKLLWAYGRNRSLVITNEITIQQLLSSGNVRLLRKRGVYDSLVFYQLKKNLLARDEEYYREYFSKSFSYQEEIFKLREFRKTVMKSDTSFPRIFNYNNLQLITSDRTMLKKYAEATDVWRSSISSYVNTLNIFKKSAVNLLVFLKKEYHLE
jgi:hypothetical protein